MLGEEWFDVVRIRIGWENIRNITERQGSGDAYGNHIKLYTIQNSWILVRMFSHDTYYYWVRKLSENDEVQEQQDHSR